MTSALRILALVCVVAIIGGAFYVMSIPDSGSSVSVGENETVGETPTTTPTYESAQYGISFRYPDTYVLTERDMEGSAQRRHHVITLMDKVAAANIPENGEGPTSITVEIFQNDLDKQDVEQWVKGTNNSNFKLSPDGTLSEGQVAGSPSVSYTWDGLYRGESTVFAHSQNIVMASVTYLTPSDQIRADFAAILASIALK